MAEQQSIRVAVVSTLDQIEQEWLSQVALDPRVSWLDRSAVLPAALEIVQRSRPDVVVVDRTPNEAEDFIRKVYTALPGTACVAVLTQADPQVMRKLMLAGARDVVYRPVRAPEMLQSILAAASVEQERQTRNPNPIEPAGPGRGKLIAVVSPKGGTGSTFVAANLSILLHQLTAGRVAVADFNMQFGHLGTHLNIFARHSLQNLIENHGEIDDAMLATVLQQHSSGVHVLLAPTSPEIAGELTSDQAHVILDQLQARYSYLVTDTWGVIDDVTLTLLSRADEVLVVCTPEIPALKNVKFFLEYMREQELTRGRVSIVLNRFPSVDGVSLEDVQQHLRHEVAANIPSAGQLVTYSVNRGVPVAISHPQSWVGQSLTQLASYVAGEQANALSSAPQKSKGLPGIAAPGRGLFGMLRRPA